MPEGLNKQSNKAELENRIASLESDKQEAEMSLEGEKAGSIEKQIQALKQQMESLGDELPTAEVSSSEKTQLEKLEVPEAEAEKVTAGVDEKIAGKEEDIKNLEQGTEKRVEEVKNIEKEVNMTNAEMDFFATNGNVEGFQKSLIASLEARIRSEETHKNAIDSGTYGGGNPSFNKEFAKQDADNKIAQLKEKIERAKADPKNLAEYQNRVDPNPSPAAITGIEGVAGLNGTGLAARYAKEIEGFNAEDKKSFGADSEKTYYPQKFDKLLGLAQVAAQEGDTETLTAIKNLGSRIKLPDEITQALEKAGQTKESKEITAEELKGSPEEIAASLDNMKKILSSMTADHEQQLRKFSKVADEVIVLKGWRPVFEKDLSTAVDETSEIQAGKKLVDTFAGIGDQHGFGNSGMVYVNDLEEALKNSPSISLRSLFKKQEEDLASKIKKSEDYLNNLTDKKDS